MSDFRGVAEWHHLGRLVFGAIVPGPLGHPVGPSLDQHRAAAEQQEVEYEGERVRNAPGGAHVIVQALAVGEGLVPGVGNDAQRQRNNNRLAQGVVPLRAKEGQYGHCRNEDCKGNRSVDVEAESGREYAADQEDNHYAVVVHEEPGRAGEVGVENAEYREQAVEGADVAQDVYLGVGEGRFWTSEVFSVGFVDVDGVVEGEHCGAHFASVVLGGRFYASRIH